MGRERAGQARLWRAWAVVAAVLAAVGSARGAEEVTAPDESGLYTLTSTSIEHFIESGDLSVVLFWAPYNSASVKVRPTILELAKMARDYRPTINVASIDCKTHQDACSNLNVRFFPHIGYYSGGVGVLGDFPFSNFPEYTVDDIFDSVKMFETPYLYKPKKVAVQNKVKTLQKLIKRSDVVMVATFREPLKASTHFQNFKKAVSILSQESDATVKAVAVTSKETAAALEMKMLEVAAFIDGKQAAKFRFKGMDHTALYDTMAKYYQAKYMN